MQTVSENVGEIFLCFNFIFFFAIKLKFFQQLVLYNHFSCSSFLDKIHEMLDGDFLSKLLRIIMKVGFV